MKNIYFSEFEDIYFPKTREYFKEVLSSYSNENYRSATVMLYSVAVCDILFKLQELKDMYNDTVATEILRNVDKSRNSHDNKSKSKWEKELIDDIYNKTSLLDLESYTNLNHLYDHRNFSAHPALNENYELISPSAETVIAHIKNIYTEILIKPPVFIKNIVELLTEDLKTKKEIYKNEYNKLQDYLNNKYFSKMSISMKKKLFSTMWKFCFCMSDDEQCKENRKINRKALQILYDTAQEELLSYIQEDNKKFLVAMDDAFLLEFVIFLSHCPLIYEELDEDVKLHIDSIIEKSNIAKAISWFKTNDLFAHLQKLKGYYEIKYSEETMQYMISYYADNGLISELYDYFVFYYGDSSSYDVADNRFDSVIESNLSNFTLTQLKTLVEASNENSQIYDRRRAYSANTKIAKEIVCKNKDFNFDEFEYFNFNKEILDKKEQESSNAD